MEADKADRAQLGETGWFRAPDGKWRFEIDDSGASLVRCSKSALPEKEFLRPAKVRDSCRFQVDDAQSPNSKLFDAYRNQMLGKFKKWHFTGEDGGRGCKL